MQRYTLTARGLENLKWFLYETGNADFLDACISEAESIASHAFSANEPARLAVEDRGLDRVHNLSMPREWFEVAE